MKLLDFLKNNQNKSQDLVDKDYFDAYYDACITVCLDLDEKEMDPYHRFCRKFFNSVQIAQSDVVFWSSLIENNITLFREFSKKYWSRNYKDSEEFVYQWLQELHLYCSGAANDNIYEKMILLLDKCEYKENILNSVESEQDLTVEKIKENSNIQIEMKIHDYETHSYTSLEDIKVMEQCIIECINLLHNIEILSITEYEKYLCQLNHINDRRSQQWRK